jgi:hypothetical protein
MATQNKVPKKPRVVPPFQGVNPPEDLASPAPSPPPPKPVNEMSISPEAQRRADEEERLQRLRDESGRAAETSRRSSMGTLKRASGGTVGSASKRADGCAQRGKTKGRFV